MISYLIDVRKKFTFSLSINKKHKSEFGQVLYSNVEGVLDLKP